MSKGPIFIGGAPPDTRADSPHPADPDEALRLRAADALERAFGFVDAHGDALARVRLEVIVEQRGPSALVEAISASQAADGTSSRLEGASAGWVGRELCAAGFAPGAVGALEALWLLAEARSLQVACAEAAVLTLSKAQAEDGAWSSSADEESRLFATALCAGVLGRTRSVRPEVLARARAFVGERWQPERAEGQPWWRVLAYAHFFTNAGDEELSDEALQWCGRELEKGFRTRRVEALAIVETLLACNVGALPGAQLDPAELLTALLGEQASDGSFDALATGGPSARVAGTLQAMRGTIGFCAAL